MIEALETLKYIFVFFKFFLFISEREKESAHGRRAEGMRERILRKLHAEHGAHSHDSGIMT